MKIKSFFLLTFLSLSLLTKAQCFPVDTLKLNTTYRLLEKNPGNEELKKQFFDSFPNTWFDFISTYGYSSQEGYDLSMYFMVNKHLDALGSQSSKVSDAAYCEKIVSLAIGAILDADGPNALHGLEHAVMKNKTKAMMSVIANLTEPDQMLYWQFYWSALFKKDYVDEYEQLRKKLISDYPNETKIMDIAYEYFCGKVLFGSWNHINGSKLAFEGR